MSNRPLIRDEVDGSVHRVIILEQDCFLEVTGPAAEAKKAEGATDDTRLTPRPPLRTGRLAS